MEESFAKAAERFREHYGWEMSPTILRDWTLRHAQQSQQRPKGQAGPPAAQIITGLDGSMIPIMCPASQGDRRKNKTLLWREARVAIARRQGEVTARYGASLDEALGAGLMWRETVELVGLDAQSKVHAVGDGAKWILEQCDRQFGSQGTFLVDLYHVSQYLGAAAPHCAGACSQKWLEEQKGALCEGRLKDVLAQLQAHLEPQAKDGDGKTPPVRQAFGYIDERKAHLDYPAALAAELPLGSGEVESAHRHLVQGRLKKAGAWWREPNARALLQMRVLRANDRWAEYWKDLTSLN